MVDNENIKNGVDKRLVAHKIFHATIAKVKMCGE